MNQAASSANVVVLVSGQGTILEAMVEAGVPVRAVLADRACRGLRWAASQGIEAILVDRADFGGFTTDFDRQGYTDALQRRLNEASPDLVAMAGFGTVLAPSLFEAYAGRILNTHPSLLPDFPGWHGVRDALAAGVEHTGCTVHLATAELDAGPILAQASVPVAPGDTEATVHERIKAVERTLYPETVLRYLADRVGPEGGERR